MFESLRDKVAGKIGNIEVAMMVAARLGATAEQMVARVTDKAIEAINQALGLIHNQERALEQIVENVNGVYRQGHASMQEAADRLCEQAVQLDMQVSRLTDLVRGMDAIPRDMLHQGYEFVGVDGRIYVVAPKAPKSSKPEGIDLDKATDGILAAAGRDLAQEGGPDGKKDGVSADIPS